MAQFKVLERSFIDNTIREAGDLVELPEGVEPGVNLQAVEPVNASRKSADPAE